MQLAQDSSVLLLYLLYDYSYKLVVIKCKPHYYGALSINSMTGQCGVLGEKQTKGVITSLK